MPRLASGSLAADAEAPPVPDRPTDPTRGSAAAPTPIGAPATSDLVRALADGYGDAARPLRAALTRPLVALAHALDDTATSSERTITAALDDALTAAIAAVQDDPQGPATLDGGRWDATGVGALALEGMLAALGRPLPLRSPRLRPLDLQQRIVLLLIEVELLDTEEVAALFATTVDEIADHTESMRERLALDEPDEPPCPDWGATRGRHRLDGAGRLGADLHIESCATCSVGMERLDRRRDGLARHVPGLGWTKLGVATVGLATA